MNTQDNGGPAFPAHHFDLADNEHGMTLRDYFAAALMQGICGSGEAAPTQQMHFDNIAEDSYRMADAMLKARNN